MWAGTHRLQAEGIACTEGARYSHDIFEIGLLRMCEENLIARITKNEGVARYVCTQWGFPLEVKFATATTQKQPC